MGLEKRSFRWWWVGLVGSLSLLLVLPALFGDIVDLKITKAFGQIDAYDTALTIYHEKFGDYPVNEDGLEALKRAGLLKRISRDPWGSPYIYWNLASMPRPMIYSAGANSFDEAGAGDDITTPEKQYCCLTYGIDCPPTWHEISAIVAIVLLLGSLIIGFARRMFLLSKWIRARSWVAIRQGTNLRPVPNDPCPSSPAASPTTRPPAAS